MGVGLLLVALGVLLLLDATGTLQFGEFFSTYWPVLLILWGLLAVRRERGRSVPGTIVALLGVGFLLENLDVFADDWLSRAWPVAIIVVGAALVIDSLRGGRGAARAHGRRATSGDARISSGDRVEAFAVLGGRREAVTSSSWRGGTATAVMGGVELDLRGARPSPEGAELRATAVMGGIEIKVPEGWAVELRGLPLLGSFENATTPGVPAEGAPRLLVTGTAIMGGVEVKH